MERKRIQFTIEFTAYLETELDRIIFDRKRFLRNSSKNYKTKKEIRRGLFIFDKDRFLKIKS